MTEIEQGIRLALETAIVEGSIADSASISKVHLLPGGASKETWQVDVTLKDSEWEGEHALVMRRPLGGKIFATALDLESEFWVLQAAYDAGDADDGPWREAVLDHVEQTVVKKLQIANPRMLAE